VKRFEGCVSLFVGMNEKGHKIGQNRRFFLDFLVTLQQSLRVKKARGSIRERIPEEVTMETAIGVFDSRERAEEAVKELVQKQIPEQAIIFLTRSESEAMNFGKEIGSYAGGFMGGALGATAGCIGATLALIPGFGQVFALGFGGAALLGYLGSKAGASITKSLAEEPGQPQPSSDDKAGENAAYFLEVLKSGRSLVLVQSEFHDVAQAASAILDRHSLGKYVPSAEKTQSSTRKIDGVTVVDFRGRIAFGDGNTKLREAISNLSAAGVNKVLLNLQEVDFVDSSGIGEIVKAHMAIRKQGGHLKLACLTKPVSDLLQSTALNKLFEIYADEATAVRSFENAASAAVN
jgi:anti-sigma B factor antagonist